MIIGLTHTSGKKTFINTDHLASFADRDEKVNPIKPNGGKSGQWLTVVHMAAGPTPLYILRPTAYELAEIIDNEEF